MQNMKFTASAIVSELQSSDIYLSVKARLFSLKTNLNGVRVTEAFLDLIVENEDKYIGIQLYADVRGLLANRPIGHMYNPRTGEFKTTPVGSFVKFLKLTTKDDTFLVGTVRIMKRNKAVCEAISDLFVNNELKFSFLINCGKYITLEDGTIVIDADPANYFEGEAIVTMPACLDAVALELVAELTKGDEDTMPEVIVAEENISSEENSTEAIAETVVEETHVEVDEVRTFDTDTCEHALDRIEHVTTVSYIADSSAETAEEVSNELTAACNKEVCLEEEASCKKEVCELEDAACKKEVCELEDASCKKNAEEEIANLINTIAELKTELNNVKTEIAELKTVKVSAEKSNPFMALMSIPNKYSLLLRESKPSTRKYNLLLR